MTQPRKKASYVGAPAIFKLDLACAHLNRAYGEGYGCYLVGSALQHVGWRDIDVVLILDDEAFQREFPSAEIRVFELDVKWQLVCVGLSMVISEQTGLPIDFKIQPQSWANERHKGPRHALGCHVEKQP